MSGHDADDAKRKALKKTVRERWAQPLYVQFPEMAPVKEAEKIAVPAKIVARSEALARAFLVPDAKFPDDLINSARFLTPAHWALYWCIASASSFVCGDIRLSTNENKRTSAFEEHLTNRMLRVDEDLGDDAQIDMAVSPIWAAINPALKEAAVGADLLLVLDMGFGESAAGQTEEQTQTSRSPCVQLFWMQAKLADTAARDEKAIYTLDYGQKKKEPANEELEQDSAAKVVAAQEEKEPEFQFERLYNVHDPARGSYAFYAQYANQIPFVPVVSVGDLVAPTKKKHKAKLTETGARFAEWLVERTIPPSTGSGAGGADHVHASAVAGGEAATAGSSGEDLSKAREAWGSFSSFDDILAFLKLKSADVPYLMVTLCVRDAREHMMAISQQLQTYFDELIQQIKQNRAASKPSDANNTKPGDNADAADGTGAGKLLSRADFAAKLDQKKGAANGQGPKTDSAPRAEDGASSTPPEGNGKKPGLK